MMPKTIACLFFLFFFWGIQAQVIIADHSSSNSFAIHQANILFDDSEPKLIKIAAQLLQQDVKLVSHYEPTVQTKLHTNDNVVIIGTPKSKYIQELLSQKKLTTQHIPTEWDGYTIQVIDQPFNNISKALVIIGTNKRGAAYGALYLSEKMGVSPWYWWADVPVKNQSQLFISIENVYKDAPLVKYRGIFINDEAPALSNWSKEKFGGFNHHFYTKVFELILRNKGNFLWPAMWGSAFYDDDYLNPQVADDWGIVIGTSHHEPLMRAHDEWRRYGKGAWNYQTNDSTLRSFWKSSLYRAKNEKIITLGMRGDGDEPMSNETATDLLERIVADQRKIIEEVTGQPADHSPQVWALYKEVQDYFDKGMRVPEDVTLLLCDDNWGNVRRLPKLTDPPRKGGYGMYYHFDYVGGPRNYKWINTNPLPRIWEQMNLSWEHGVKELWIVNVGDIKPMELPISFFLSQAWNPPAFTIDNVWNYTVQWTKQQFGDKHADTIANLLEGYTKLNGRRKPELLDEKTFELHQEFPAVIKEWNQLLSTARTIQNDLSKEYHDAYFQLVLHPIWASTNLYQMYYHTALNHHYFQLNDSTANKHAKKVTEYYITDSLISVAYHQLKRGKWNHIMSQTHIGYTYWQQPEKQEMPTVKWVTNHSPKKENKVNNTIKIKSHRLKQLHYDEVNGFVSIPSTGFTRKKENNSIQWKIMRALGREGDAMTSFPYTISIAEFTEHNPYLEYDIYTSSTGKVKLTTYFSPTLNIYHSTSGLRYAIQIDNDPPQIIGINANDHDTRVWDRWMTRNIIESTSEHQIKKSGKHTVRYWMIDNSMILQKLVLNFGGIDPTLFGPPSTIHK